MANAGGRPTEAASDPQLDERLRPILLDRRRANISILYEAPLSFLPSWEIPHMENKMLFTAEGRGAVVPPLARIKVEERTRLHP
jgi:hypothetical protein